MNKTLDTGRIMDRTFSGIPWIYDIIILIKRSSFVSTLREEKLRSTEIQHIMYSQSNPSSVAHSIFMCPTAEKANSSTQCQTILPSQYTIHYDTSHLSFRNVWVSPGINFSERKHTPLNKAGCTLKQQMPNVKNNSACTPCFDVVKLEQTISKGERNNCWISECKQTR